MFASIILAAMAATPYPTMAPLDQYLMSPSAEVALARSAAPASVSANATVYVLTRDGYKIAAQGSDAFVCLVERGWDADPDNPNFWNPNVRGPDCFNAAAVRTYLPIILMRTDLVVAGKSKAQLAAAIASAFASKKLPSLESGAMSYMLSPRQYLTDDKNHHWHPHLMFFVAGTDPTSWGGNLVGSPVFAAPDPLDGLTIFMVPVRRWSDGTADTG